MTQIKIGVWPGTGFEWQMVSIFSVQIFWTTFQDGPFILENFRSGKPKQSYHLHPNRNFRNFLVNGKQPRFPSLFFFSESCLWRIFQPPDLDLLFSFVNSCFGKRLRMRHLQPSRRGRRREN